MDNITGILYAKDLLPYFNRDLVSVNIKDILREPYFVPESKPASELLTELREEQLHIAVVLDEFGGIAGLIFMEDLIETVIGEIEDEYDQGLSKVEQVTKQEYIFSSRVPVEEVNEIMKLELPTEHHATIGGLAFYLFGKILVQGEVIERPDVLIEIEKMTDNTIRQIRIKKLSSY